MYWQVTGYTARRTRVQPDCLVASWSTQEGKEVFYRVVIFPEQEEDTDSMRSQGGTHKMTYKSNPGLTCRCVLLSTQVVVSTVQTERDLDLQKK